MKTGLIIGIVVVIAILIVGGIFLFKSPSQINPPASNNGNIGNTGAQTYNVEISNFAFSPLSLSIKAGDTIIWTNKDSSSHTVTSDSGSELTSNTLLNGQTYSHTFNAAGTYNYHCAIHPNMKAKVIAV